MRTILTILICCLYTLSGQAQLGAKLEKEINKILRYDIHINYDKVPGFVVGVLIGDSTYIYGFGTVEKGLNQPPDGTTIFEIGDVTKAFTASLLSQLVDEGHFDYETELDTYLPDHMKNQYSRSVTLHDLVTHTSGLPKMPFDFGLREKETHNPYAHYTRSDLISFYREFVFDPVEKRKYVFSNVNYALIGVALEHQMNDSYEHLLQKYILDPIDMPDTRIHLDEEQEARLAKGYSLSGQEMPYWRYQSFEASVGLKSTMNDLIRFIRVQIGQEQPGLSKSFAATHSSIYETEIDKRTFIGRGWHVLKIKRFYDLIAHSGTTSGHRAFIGFVKETETAVIVLSNSKMGMNGLGYLILKMINRHWKKK